MKPMSRKTTCLPDTLRVLSIFLALSLALSACRIQCTEPAVQPTPTRTWASQAAAPASLASPTTASELAPTTTPHSTATVTPTATPKPVQPTFTPTALPTKTVPPPPTAIPFTIEYVNVVVQGVQYYTGTCPPAPPTFTWEGYGAASGTGTMTYDWEISTDGVSFSVTESGSRDFNDGGPFSFLLNRDVTSTSRVYARLHIKTPSSQYSNADFVDIFCTP